MTLLQHRIDLTSYRPDAFNTVRMCVAAYLAKIEPPTPSTDGFWAARAEETERRYQLLKKSACDVLLDLDSGYLHQPAGARDGEPFATAFTLYATMIRTVLAAGDHVADPHGGLGRSAASAAGVIRTLTEGIVRARRELNDIPLRAWEIEHRRTTEPDNEYAQQWPAMPATVYESTMAWWRHPTLNTETKRIAWYDKQMANLAEARIKDRVAA